MGQLTVDTNHGMMDENTIPAHIPEMSDAAPNMPAVAACCGSTVL